MNIENVQLLMFAEDTGAANCIAKIPEILAEKGVKYHLLANGAAIDYFNKRGVHSNPNTEGLNASQVIAFLAPDLILVGTSENLDSLGLFLIKEARATGIETIGIIDAFPNADRRFCGRSNNPLAFIPDWLIVPDLWTKQAYIDLGVDSSHIKVLGHPHYDFVLEQKDQLAHETKTAVRRRVLSDNSENRKVVTFAAEGPVRLKPKSNQYLSECTIPVRNYNLGRTEIVLEAFIKATNNISNKPFMVLRLHPKDELSDYEAYLDEFDLVSNNGPPLDLIYASDIVVGITSTILIEALLLGASVLSILPHKRDIETLSINRMNVSPYVTNEMDLQMELNNFLHNDNNGEVTLSGDLIVPDSLSKTVDFIEKRLEIS